MSHVLIQQALEIQSCQFPLQLQIVIFFWSLEEGHESRKGL